MLTQNFWTALGQTYLFVSIASIHKHTFYNGNVEYFLESSSTTVIVEGLCPWQVGLMAVGPTSQPLSSSAVTVEETHHGFWGPNCRIPVICIGHDKGLSIITSKVTSLAPLPSSTLMNRISLKHYAKKRNKYIHSAAVVTTSDLIYGCKAGRVLPQVR